MNSISGSFTSLSQQEIQTLAKELTAEATKATEMIQAFDKANDIIQNPKKNGMTLQESMKATYDFNVKVLNRDMMNRMGKALHIDTEV